jgi:hypothetical protein
MGRGMDRGRDGRKYDVERYIQYRENIRGRDSGKDGMGPRSSDKGRGSGRYSLS